MSSLPAGYAIELDDDGDAWLLPPSDVTIFSMPGEMWLITDDFMAGRDWNSSTDLEVAASEYLRTIAITPKEAA